MFYWVKRKAGSYQPKPFSTNRSSLILAGYSVTVTVTEIQKDSRTNGAKNTGCDDTRSWTIRTCWGSVAQSDHIICCCAFNGRPGETAINRHRHGSLTPPFDAESSRKLWLKTERRSCRLKKPSISATWNWFGLSPNSKPPKERQYITLKQLGEQPRHIQQR